MEFLFIAGFFFMIAAIFDTLTFDEKKAKKGKLKKAANSIAKSSKRVASHRDDTCQAANIRHPKIGTLGLEDRENDWLAQQLRAEAKSKHQF